MQTTQHVERSDPPVNHPIAEDKTTDEVRQGTTGQNVRYVLVISLVGTLIALTAAWYWVT
jgi:hypothetical protein